MAQAGKTRHEKFKLKPKEIRLVWMVAMATMIIFVLELLYGLGATIR